MDVPETHQPGPPQEQSNDEASLRALIRDSNISCAFQPIVNVNHGEIIGFEGLLRPNSDSGFTNPTELFAAASTYGLSEELEAISRETILQSATDWPEGVMLFMNCEPRTAATRGFASSLIKQIARVGTVPHENIVVEITERAETSELEILLEQLRTIRAAGLQVAIDDLGAGTSGLQRIMQLRPQWLKIDRELVTGIASDQYRRNLVDVLVRFTRVSGVRLVAEGIETHDDLGAIMDMGVQHVQGYLLGRPAAALQELPSDVKEWMLGQSVQLQQKMHGPNSAFLSGIMRTPFTLGENTTVEVAREKYWSANGPSGLVLLDDKERAVGWVSTEKLLSVEFDNESGMPLIDLQEAMPSIVEPSILISEALSLLASRKGYRFHDPFLVGHDGQIVGEVSVTDLLQEACRLTSDLNGYYTQLSGLPGRVQCERQFDSLIRRKQEMSALYIDIVGFHKYNEQFGYEVGDLILRILSGLVTDYVNDHAMGEFVGHLGDDRFLLVTFTDHPGVLAKSMIEAFEGATERFALCGMLTQNKEAFKDLECQVSLRIVCLRDAANREYSARDIQRHATALLARTDFESIGHSLFIDADSEPPKPELRLIA